MHEQWNDGEQSVCSHRHCAVASNPANALQDLKVKLQFKFGLHAGTYKHKPCSLIVKGNGAARFKASFESYFVQIVYITSC